MPDDDDVKVAPQILRSAAETWFPRMGETTSKADLSVSTGVDQVGEAFIDPFDWANGANWKQLAQSFMDVLAISTVRYAAAGEALRKAADSYEDADEKSALRIEATTI